MNEYNNLPALDDTEGAVVEGIALEVAEDVVSDKQFIRLIAWRSKHINLPGPESGIDEDAIAKINSIREYLF